MCLNPTLSGRLTAAAVAAGLLLSSAHAQPRRGPVGGGVGQPARIFERFPILRKMIDAEPRLRFTGSRIVETKIGAERLRNTEIIVRDGMLQRTEFTSDSPNAGQIIVENGRKRRHFFPATNEIQVLPARREEMIGRFRMMFKQIADGAMNIKSAGGEEIAGRRTQELSFQDRAGNTVQRLWIDNETGMLLKRELFDPVGTRIGFFEFTRINFSPKISREDFEIRRKGAVEVTPDDQVLRLAKRLGLPPSRIPANEPYDLEIVRPLDLGGTRGFMQTYFGERGRVSLYQIDGDIDPRRLTRLAGGSNLNTHSWHVGPRTFVLVGDVPQAELERLARLVR